MPVYVDEPTLTNEEVMTEENTRSGQPTINDSQPTTTGHTIKIIISLSAEHLE